MKFPVIIVNFKEYREGSLERAVHLSEIAENVAKREDVNIIVAPNFLDLHRVVNSVSIPVYAQHADPVGYGAYTGHISPYHLKDLGVSGCLLNHSERKIPIDDLKKTAKMAIEDVGLEVVVCVGDLRELEEVISLNLPVNAIAIEPPELIGSGKAVSKYKPDLIVRAVELAERAGYPLLCGAGIVTGSDVKKAMELGTRGILVASGVVKSSSPEKVLTDFAVNLKSTSTGS